MAAGKGWKKEEEHAKGRKGINQERMIEKKRKYERKDE